MFLFLITNLLGAGETYSQSYKIASFGNANTGYTVLLEDNALSEFKMARQLTLEEATATGSRDSLEVSMSDGLWGVPIFEDNRLL